MKGISWLSSTDPSTKVFVIEILFIDGPGRVVRLNVVILNIYFTVAN